MDDRFVATFVVATPPAETWQVLVECRTDEDHWWLPGFVTTAEVCAVDEGRRIHARKVEQPCAGTEIVVSLEACESGTTVTIVQSGFGTLFDQALDALSIGWSFIVADCALYLERRVDGGRHPRPWAILGCNVHETPTGLVVDAAWGGSATAAGLEPGDLLLSVGGAPILTRRELETVMRVYGNGDEIEATWARGREVVGATGAL